MAVADMLTQPTGATDPRLDWARSTAHRGRGADCEGVVLTHADDRYLEVRSYDYDAPACRQWKATVIDRETGESITLAGEFQRDATRAALKLIGAAVL